jgi:hypothetical protein
MTIPTSYSSKADQNTALDRLNRSYEELVRGIHNYYDLDLPYSLCHYRPAKHDRLVSREIALQFKGLTVAREVIKATPIVKPLPAKQRREAEITLRFGENASLKAAMLAYAPALAAEFDGGWRHEIAKRLTRGDNKLEYIGYYGKHKGVSAQDRSSNNERYQFWQNVVNNLCFADDNGKVRSTELAAAAKRYGEETAIGWYYKMATKLGQCVDVNAITDPSYANLTVEGTLANSSTRVVIQQQVVYKVSSKGNPFHQFPAHIYVDGRFTTEAEFAKAFHPGVA